MTDAIPRPESEWRRHDHQTHLGINMVRVSRDVRRRSELCDGPHALIAKRAFERYEEQCCPELNVQRRCGSGES
jgi:hypothetical protein